MLRIVREGYKLQFVNCPQFPFSVVSRSNSVVNHSVLSTQIDSLLSPGAISKVPLSSNNLCSRIFTVKKANGKDRMILDLSLLNTQIIKVSFQMETHDRIIELLNSNDYMASIDLADAFFSIPVHTDFRKFLAFQFDNEQYMYNVLPFGLTSSPRVFSKVLKPVIAYLRSMAIKISFYLDDIFLCANSSSVLTLHVNQTLNLLTSLGFTPNYKESHLNPCKILKHLGYIWNSSDMTLSIPPEKIDITRQCAHRILSSPKSLKEISSFIGRVVSHRTAFSYAPLHFRHLQLQYCSFLSSNIQWDSLVILNDNSLSDVQWWSNMPETLPPRPLLHPKPSFTMYCDASSSGWGGILSSGSSTSGSWSTEEGNLHINFLELKAVYLCVSCFLSELHNESLQVFSDNATAVFYINKMGGTQSSDLCFLALEFWDLLRLNNISCQATHIAGTSNSIADGFSREEVDRHDYGLSGQTFKSLVKLVPFPLKFDLFASKSSKKLPSYASRLPDPDACILDAFSISWPSNLYIFPPIPLISKVVQKLIVDKSDDVLLITPAWPGLICLPLILSLLISSPIFIPHFHLIGQPPTRHPFAMMGWPISTVAEKSSKYLSELSLPSQPVSRKAHSSLTRDTGENFMSLLKLKGHNVVQFL